MDFVGGRGRRCICRSSTEIFLFCRRNWFAFLKKFMSLVEVVYRCLQELARPVNSGEVCAYILKNKYYDFSKTQKPSSTVSRILGDFDRNNDARVSRDKQPNGTYNYFLTENMPEESAGGGAAIITENPVHYVPAKAPHSPNAVLKVPKSEAYRERDLHKLLSTYLKGSGTFSKTIFHEKSNAKDPNQIWTHPDMVGISFLKLVSKASQSLLKSVKKIDTFKLISYELKREINSDSDLKQAFFQAVSNSSWANFGYLVAHDFKESLRDEMTRLNQSFGIGIIQLNTSSEESKILLPATFRELDFKTIDKLCSMNKPFEKFMEQVEKWLMADDKYLKGAEKELDEFCDDYFTTYAELEQYCRQKNIPLKG